MSVEVAGELLAEAVIADELGRTDEGRKVEPHHSCANCKSALVGRFCHECGQVGHVHRSLLHMFEEFLHGIFHFDTKAWRTLPALAFRPGRLTRAYIDGERARHVSPLALFLFMVFVMVMAFSLTNSVPEDLGGGPSEDTRTRLSKKIEDSQTRLKTLQVEVEQGKGSPAQQEALAKRVAKGQVKLAALQETLKKLNTEAAEGEKRGQDKDEIERKLGEMEAQAQLAENMPSLATPYVARKLSHAAENPDLLLYKIKGAAAKYSVLLMPISLPFLWLLFPFSRRFSMFDHAVFSLYSLAFMAGFLGVLAVVGALGLSVVSSILSLVVPPAHMFAQLRGTYQLSRAGAAWRTVALLFVAMGSLTLYTLLVMILAM